MKQPVAAERVARWTEYKRVRELERQARRDAVIAEFGGDSRALAGEILRLRHAVGQLVDAAGWAQAGSPFVVLPPPPGIRSSDG